MTEKNLVSQETMQEILRQKYATREESKFRREIKKIFTLLNDKCDEADAIFPGLSFALMNQIFAPGGLEKFVPGISKRAKETMMNISKVRKTSSDEAYQATVRRIIKMASDEVFQEAYAFPREIRETKDGRLLAKGEYGDWRVDSSGRGGNQTVGDWRVKTQKSKGKESGPDILDTGILQRRRNEKDWQASAQTQMRIKKAEADR